MTPNQARAARAMLRLDMKSVCELTTVGKRTLTEFEAGFRTINDVTMAKLKAFYISKGISFGGKATDQETVSLRRIQDRELQIAHAVGEKIEYIDMFDVASIEASIDSFANNVLDLEEKIDFSRTAISYILKSAIINQRELSNILGCTSAFVSAIAAGKKSIPVRMADKLQGFFENTGINIRNAIACEKQIWAAVAEMRDRSAAVKQELRTIYGDATGA